MHAFSYSNAAVKQNKNNMFSSSFVLKTGFLKDLLCASFFSTHLGIAGKETCGLILSIPYSILPLMCLLPRN